MPISASPTFSPTGNIGANIQGGNGDVNASVGVGFNPFSGNVGVTPTVQFGTGEGNQTGAQLGGTAGAVAGSELGPVGAAVGHAIGSAVGSVIGGVFNPSQAAKETEKRKGFLNALKGHAFEDDFSFLFPDGTSFSFNQDSHEGVHPWKNPQERTGDVGERPLFNYETDYTNDTDFVAGMAGISLGRLLSGGKNKAIDQTGQLLGNAFLGKVGYGAEFNQENFNAVMTNARAMYARSGIQTKEDMLSLANKAFSEGRINDTDYAAMQQTASLLFDGNYGLAESLMGGRRKGLETAARTPTGSASGRPQNRPGRIYSPVLSPEEALLSVKPYFDFYKQNYPIKGRGASRGATSIVEGIGAITGIAGAYNAANRASGGAIGFAIHEGLGAVADFLGIGGSNEFDLGSDSGFDFGAGLEDDTSGIFSGDDGASSSSDFDLGGFSFDF